MVDDEVDYQDVSYAFRCASVCLSNRNVTTVDMFGESLLSASAVTSAITMFAGIELYIYD